MSAQRKYKRAEDLEGAQRAAAEAVGNAVVAAGAGSGKTTVLAARYMRLLETGRMKSGERVHARNILVLTFTRKATAEMYARIYGSLAAASAEASAAAAQGGDAELAGHLAACLAEFSQAQISTFDSFAARIARSGSSRFGLAPDFSVDEEGARERASDLALGFILEHREEEALRDLVSALGLEGTRDDVLADLAVRRMSISSPPGFAAFHAVQQARLEEMEAGAREGLLAMRAAVLDYGDARTTETSKRWLDAIRRDPGADEAAFLGFIEPLESLRKPGSNSKDEASLFLSDCVPGIKKAAAAYRDIAATKAAHPARLALYRRLDDFRLAWDSARRAEKMLTFRDVAMLALDTLEADSEVRRHYQELYRYVMIDEFQDDDELQKRILFLLARNEEAGDLEPDKLFFVGDEKQSIYLFRGADVSVFRRLSGELGASSPGALSLTRNFRSEPGIIDMINAIFPDVMAPLDPERGHEDFEARFESLESRPATPGVTPRLVYLELPRRADGSEEGRAGAECEAWEVARMVREAVEGASLIVADRGTGAARPARYEDFAVLLRSTGNQVHFEKYFRLFDVPYGSENACGLFSEAVACDLYYALRLALYPKDRNALAAYLRSPFAGLSDESVVRLLLSEADPLGPEAEPLVQEGERGAWARGVETRARLEAMADRAPIARCLSYLWFEAGYRAALLADPVAAAFEEHFELVHSMAVDADSRARPLAAFVAELELLVGKPDKLEVDLPRELSRGVRIMTVHKSKGLEFPVVILPQANNVGLDRAAREAWYWEEGIGPTFKPPEAIGTRSRNAFFESSKERRSALERAELKRLLYVALTRAESHIVITATAPRYDDAKGRSFRALLSGPLGLFGDSSPLKGRISGPESGEPGVAMPPFGRLSALSSGALVGLIPERDDIEYFALVADARKKAAGPIDASAIPIVERRARPAPSSVTAIAERYAARRAASRRDVEQLGIAPELAAPSGLSPEAWGSLVHAILESRLGPRPEAGDGEARLPPELREAVEEALGGEAALREAIARASRLAQVFLSSDLGLRALASMERRVELEVAIGLEDSSTRNAPRYARGSIDLAFAEGDLIVIVDYKTDTSIRKGEHDMQIAAYERAAGEIFGRRVEGWIFYLYGGGVAVRADEGGGAPRLEEAFAAESV